MKKLLAIFGLIVVFGPSAAQADFITNQLHWSSAMTDWTNVQSVARFNPALGTLTQIEFIIRSDEDTRFSVTNNSITGGSVGTVQTLLILDLFDPSHLVSPGLTNLFPITPFSFNLPVGPSVTNSVTYFATNSATWDYTSGALLAEFTAPPPPLSNNMTGVTMTFASAMFSGGNGDITQTTHADANVLLIYDYVIPEPMQATLLLAGGAVLLLRRWVKKIQGIDPS